MNTIKVKNIAELKTRKGTSESTVEVLGYYTEGDGGGGTFYWDNTSTETDNEGTIISVSTISTGRWKRNYNGVLNVKWFGAKGDSSQNENTYINKAIIEGDIFIPKGTFKINASIEVLSNRNIEIEGTILRNNTVSAFDMIVADTKNNIKIYGNGIIDGSTLLNVSISTNRFCGIRVYSLAGTCNNIEINGLTVINTTSGEIQSEGTRAAIMLENVTNSKVTNSKCYNNRATSIFIYGTNSKNCLIKNNYLYDNESIGSGISGQGYSNVEISDNIVYNTKYTAISVNGKYSVVKNNIVYNAPNNYAGITIGHDNSEADSSNSIISGNIVRNSGTDSTFVGAIAVSNSSNLRIENNIITDNSTYGIRFYGSPISDKFNNIISNNTILGNAYSGIILEWGENTEISNNLIKENLLYGVYVDGTKVDSGNKINKVIIKNNTFTFNGNHSNGAGIVNVSPTSTALKVISNNNYFEGKATDIQKYGMWVTGANAQIEVKDNTFSSYYTESTAYRISSSGSYKFKKVKSESVILLTGGDLSNSWTSSSAGYWISNEGIVHFQGVLTGGTTNSLAFTLPLGYRPATSLTFAIVANNAFAKMVVTNAGEVYLYDSNVNNNIGSASFKAVLQDAS